MPARKNLLRVKTEAAQGADSWIEYVPFTVGERFDPGRQSTTREEVQNRVKKWNWVDNDSNPFPQPEDEPSIFNAITTFEMSVLIDIVFGFQSANDVKN